jgi:SsrA-binding protein
VLIGLCRRKKLHDKPQDIKRRDDERAMARALRRQR